MKNTRLELHWFQSLVLLSHWVQRRKKLHDNNIQISILFCFMYSDWIILGVKWFALPTIALQLTRRLFLAKTYVHYSSFTHLVVWSTVYKFARQTVHKQASPTYFTSFETVIIWYLRKPDFSPISRSASHVDETRWGTATIILWVSLCSRVAPWPCIYQAPCYQWVLGLCMLHAVHCKIIMTINN